MDGHDILITFIDALTKSANWAATAEKGSTTEKLAEIFTESFIRLHDLPDVIISDRCAIYRRLLATSDECHGHEVVDDLGFSPPDRWPSRERKLDCGTVPPSIHDR